MQIKKVSINPAVFFLIASFMVGIFYILVVPYGAGFDEERHLSRIYYMSKGEFIPNSEKFTIQNEIFELSYQRRYFQSPAFDMYSREKLTRKFSHLEEDLRYGYRTQSIYSPAIFFIQAVVGRLLWWKFDFPILPTIMLQKFVGLLIYIAGVYTSIRVIPYGKWVLAALALLPAAIYQAVTLNADGFTVAASFSFIGWVVAVYLNERSGIRRRSLWALFALSIWLGLAKPGAIILLPLLFLLIKHSFPSKKWIVFLLAGVAIAIVLNAGWWSLASEGSTFSGDGAQNVSRQSSLLFSDPLSFIKPLFQGLRQVFWQQVQGFVAAYGFWAGKVPTPVFFLSMVFIFSAILAEGTQKNILMRIRIGFVAFFLLCSLSIYAIVFLANYASAGVLSLAKHGRYFIPFGPLFFLGFAGLFNLDSKWKDWMKKTAIVSFVFMQIYFSVGIYTTYYTYCGYDAYLGGKCILPIYKNLEKEGVPAVEIMGGMLVSQKFTNYCGDLENVSVFIRSVSEGSRGSLRFSLLNDESQLIASQDILVEGIGVNRYLELPISPPSDNKGTEYEIQLKSLDVLSEGGVVAPLTVGSYYPGRLIVDGTKQGSDLIIHYTCTTP